MANQEPEKQATPQTAAENQRPTFLTVLCILTFIGSGLLLLFTLIAIVGSGVSGSILKAIPGAPNLVGGAELSMAKLVINLILIAGSLYGAILMWGLKKMGFYLYSGANIVYLIISFSVIGLIITAAFIVMYYLNLKYME